MNPHCTLDHWILEITNVNEPTLYTGSLNLRKHKPECKCTVWVHSGLCFLRFNDPVYSVGSFRFVLSKIQWSSVVWGNPHCTLDHWILEITNLNEPTLYTGSLNLRKHKPEWTHTVHLIIHSSLWFLRFNDPVDSVGSFRFVLSKIQWSSVQCGFIHVCDF
jgi:hypothetical protein